MQITNGIVEFQRQRRTADYEHKKATVSLSFVVNDGENPDDEITNVAARAVAQALSMVGEKSPAKLAVEPASKPEPKPVQRTPKIVEVVELPEPTVAPAVEEPQPPKPAVEEPQSPKPAVEEPQPEITDAMLQQACARKNEELMSKGEPAGIRIKQLIVSMTGDPLKPVYTLDQTKRAEFIKRLKAL